MNISKLRTVLSEKTLSHKACALAIVELARDSSQNDIEDAFEVALRTGILDQVRANRLIALFESLASNESGQERSLTAHPEIVSLKEEIDRLTAQRHSLESRHKTAASLQADIQALKVELQERQCEASSLMEAVSAIKRQRGRLNALMQEVKE
ncbi:MAG TPA: hypothetical protein VJ464_26415 [Blastocatellia bacterium]|nr:hypothetical protein [Blastocatellia bacterium]